ncbi:MAG: hypothetical protein LBU74_03020 [Methanobacteriaceae archaeon]|jgi:Na+/H+-translocating membrane pyrophosphatase|nr:hypothetical protein [Candidatus Methanorudis spinitermitis]
MAEYSETSSIIISLILGAILTFLFDNIFVVTFVGFIATYIVNKENKSYLIGIGASLIFAVLNFFIGLILVPNIPSSIAEQISFDPTNFFIGFLVTCFISGILGFLGGFIAEKAYKRIHSEEYEY